jgi:hypothetical protein
MRAAFKGGAMTRANGLIVVFALTLACAACRRSRPDTRKLGLAAAASDSLTEAFSDIAAGSAPAPRNRPSLVGGDTLQACLDRDLGTGFTLAKTRLFDVALPPDFAPVGGARSERDAEKFGVARYEWRGSDNSTLSISGGTTERHSGWTGGISNECDIETAGAAVHVDLANASIRVNDRVIHAVFDISARPALIFEAHARNVERQAQLLHSLHTVFILPRWGVRP